MTSPPFYPRSNPAGHPISEHRPEQPHRAAGQPGPVRPDHEPAHLHGQRRGRGARARHAEIRGAHPAGPAAMKACGIAVDDVAKAVSDQNVNQPLGCPDRLRPLHDADGRRPAFRGRQVPGGHRGRAQRPAGAPGGCGQGHRQRGEHQDTAWFFTSKTARPVHLPVGDEAAGPEHGARWPTRSRPCCPPCRRSCPPPSTCKS